MPQPTAAARRWRWFVLLASSFTVFVLLRKLARGPDELTQIRASGEGWGDLGEAADGEAIDLTH
jgi:hypothetical protein